MKASISFLMIILLSSTAFAAPKSKTGCTTNVSGLDCGQGIQHLNGPDLAPAALPEPPAPEPEQDPPESEPESDTGTDSEGAPD